MNASKTLGNCLNIDTFKAVTNQSWFKFLLVVVINFIAHFWYFRDFGIYEDDHFRIPLFMTFSFDQILSSVGNYLTHPSQFQGRPLHESFILLGSFLGSKLGGISAIYLIAYGLSTLNAILFYWFVLIVTKHQPVALLSTFFFILFPTDTNQIWLTSAFGIRTSLAFLFLAFICYLKNKKALSYFIIFLSLFCYETVYWIFLLVPFFVDLPFALRRFRTHGFILLILFASVIILRRFSGESRITDLNFWQTFQMSVGQIGLGFWSILRSYPEALKSTGFAMQNQYSLLILMAFGFLLFYVFFGTINARSKSNSIRFSIVKFNAIFGGMILVSYPLNLTVWANQLSGVYTRVHMAASVGTSALLGILCYRILEWGQARGYKLWLNISLSLLLSGLMGFGLILQKDYQLNWQYQKAFWQDVIPLISDVKNGEIVLIDAQHINTLNTQQMRGNDWNTNIVLSNIFQFPNSIKPPPKVYLLIPEWQNKILAEKNMLKMSTATLIAAPDHLPVTGQESLVEPSSVILIQSDHQKFHRLLAEKIQGKEIQFKKTSVPTLSQLNHGILYPYIY